MTYIDPNGKVVLTFKRHFYIVFDFGSPARLIDGSSFIFIYHNSPLSTMRVTLLVCVCITK